MSDVPEGMKRCGGPLCKGAVRPVSEFHKNRNASDGLQAWCNTCRKEYASRPENKAKYANKKRGKFADDPEYRMAHKAYKSNMWARDPVKWVYVRLKALQSNRNKRNHNVTVDAEYLLELWLATQGRCSVTGLPFQETPYLDYGSQKRNPFAPSIDRIDSNRGYEPGNVRWVLWAVNAAFGTWGKDIFLPIARALAARNPE